ncbi:radical SAM/SPASM domain-containing protein [Bacteroides sp. 519]|uniref:radical SAM/SPASM domain-containing protein n=1 Tax=Bacteroides sp. 519 TaxID=2302937 RepID=UPI0013D042D9|nr:radical SAM protein [Bacteroides sp. 519]NDV57281.1 radical SAM protein [Bacteroides sp. 519]
MLIRQNTHAFIRFWNSMAYIESQVNHVSRIYSGKEKDFILSLSRQPQDLDDIINNLAAKHVHFDLEDLNAFIKELERLWLIVSGESEDELRNKEKSFSYAELDAVRNAFAADQQIVEISTKEAPWLRSLQLEVTSLCNEKCIHCYIPSETKDYGSMMPVEQVKSVIDQFAELSGLRIILSGGEVLIHKHVIEILEYCREKDLMIFILSNLTLMNDETLKIIKNLNVFNIQVSLYSMDESVHDNITKVKGSWKKTKRNLETLVANDIRVTISCPILKQNYKGYKELFEYAQSLNIFCYVDYVLLAQSDLCTNNLCTRMTMEQTEELLDAILDNDPKYHQKINAITSETDLDTMPFGQRFNSCEVLRSTICMTVDGNIYPCPGWQGMVVGNIYEQSLKYIWFESPRVIELRNVDKNSFKKCKKCGLKNYCDMCLVYNFNENNGDIYEVSTRFCDNAKSLKTKIKQRYKLIQEGQ